MPFTFITNYPLFIFVVEGKEGKSRDNSDQKYLPLQSPVLSPYKSALVRLQEIELVPISPFNIYVWNLLVIISFIELMFGCSLVLFASLTIKPSSI